MNPNILDQITTTDNSFKTYSKPSWLVLSCFYILLYTCTVLPALYLMQWIYNIFLLIMVSILPLIPLLIIIVLIGREVGQVDGRTVISYLRSILSLLRKEVNTFKKMMEFLIGMLFIMVLSLLLLFVTNFLLPLILPVGFVGLIPAFMLMYGIYYALWLAYQCYKNR